MPVTTVRQQPAGVEIDGDLLRTMRKRAGLTVTGLAALCDISWGYLSQIELGRRPTVSPPTFLRICEALELPPEDRDRLDLSQARRAAA